MKKIILTVSVILSLMGFAFAPAIVSAQADPSEEVLEIDTGETTALPSTGAGVPDTGIGPDGNKAVQNAAVFIGGSLLGAGIGLGVIKLRKNSFEK